MELGDVFRGKLESDRGDVEKGPGNGFEFCGVGVGLECSGPKGVCWIWYDMVEIGAVVFEELVWRFRYD